jgi:hypothetical protein
MAENVKRGSYWKELVGLVFTEFGLIELMLSYCSWTLAWRMELRVEKERAVQIQ